MNQSADERKPWSPWSLGMALAKIRSHSYLYFAVVPGSESKATFATSNAANPPLFLMIRSVPLCFKKMAAV